MDSTYVFLEFYRTHLGCMIIIERYDYYTYFELL